MSTVEQVKVFLASPGDVRRERQQVGKVIAELDRSLAGPRGLAIRHVDYLLDGHPGFGADGQKLINAQIADMSEYDLFVGIMWTRVGTRTPRAESGTIEEFNRAVKSLKECGRPEIWMYFCEAQFKPRTNEDAKQWEEVLAFRNKIRGKGLFYPYVSRSSFTDMFRSQLTKWLTVRGGTNPAVPVMPQPSPAGMGATSADALVRINGYKLCYYRRQNKHSYASLAHACGVDRRKVRRLELLPANPPALDLAMFRRIPLGDLLQMEEILHCPGRLQAGQSDDFLFQYMSYFRTYGRSSPSVARGRRKRSEKFLTRAVVFDFDGTLTKSLDNRTTWERLWVAIGRSANECADLHRRFQNSEFSHSEWCERTCDVFRAGGMRLRHVEEIANATTLVKDVEPVLRELRKRGIRLFVLSGSIRSIILQVLGEMWGLFEDVRANELKFGRNGELERIVGTPYDFLGKAKYLRNLVESSDMAARDILFVGNSCNDVWASQSGVRTLCVNPTFTDPDRREHWTYAIKEMASLREIMEFVAL